MIRVGARCDCWLLFPLEVIKSEEEERLLARCDVYSPPTGTGDM
jgi:hypothetical protein